MRLQHIIKSIIIALSLALVACEKTAPKFENYGTLDYAGTKYALSYGRFNLDSIDNDRFYAHLDFAPKSLTISDRGMSGHGTYLSLNLNLECDSLAVGSHTVGEEKTINPINSYIETISEDKKDTSRTIINSGYIDYVLDGDTMPKFSFDLKTNDNKKITGSYLGSLITNFSVDADSLGYVQRDTINLAIGHANMWKWEKLFDENIYYYELELLSSNMRYQDNGKMKDGAKLVLGFLSSNKQFPADGTYTASEDIKDFSLYYGHKQNNTYWGSYWQEIKNTSTVGRTNILYDTVSLSKNSNGEYTIKINVKDQLNKFISGEYTGKINSKHYLGTKS